MSALQRIISLVDMDCFYCQVEECLNPHLKGKPIAVVQYNTWKGGGIIAVNYPAREKGVTRHMRGNEAKKHCPEIKLVHVPTVRGKADLTKYRDAGKRVSDVLQTFNPHLERASVDEAYLDITKVVESRIQDLFKVTEEHLKNTHVVNYQTNDFLNYSYNNEFFGEHNLKLVVGAAFTEEIRAAVYEQTGYRCSAGIAHNKILAKLAAGLHKPNQQTVLPQEGLQALYKNLPVHKIKSLGGKFGQYVSESLAIKTMGQLSQFSERELQQKFDEKTGHWLYNVSQGIDLEPVNIRLISKSIGCCKKFPGRTALTTEQSVGHWINELAEELSERLEKDLKENNRRPKNITVSYSQEINRRDVSSSRTQRLNFYDAKKIAEDTFTVIKKHCLRPDNSYHIKFISLSAGKFDDCKNKLTSISNFLTRGFNKNSSNFAHLGEELEENKAIESNQANSDIMHLILEQKMQNGPTKLHDDETSIFSKSTIPPECETQFIYLDNAYLCENSEIFNEKIANLLHDSNIENVELMESKSDVDSIKDEIAIEEVSGVENENPSSFFQKYMGAVSRDFNTSKILDETADTSDSSNNEENKTNILEQNQKSPTRHNILKEPNIMQSIIEESKKILCDVCKKFIVKCEMAPHMDYHFALQLVKEEAHLYKNPSNNTELKRKKTSPGQSNKKKIAKLDDNCPKLTSFVQVIDKETLHDSRKCEECGKQIATTDIASHKDYHAAKKLHFEINTFKKCPASTPNRIKNRVTKKPSKDLKKLSKVTSFFKPL